MTDVAVLKLLGLLLLFEIVLLVLWTVFDLPEVVLQQNLQDQTQATVCRWNQIAFVAVSLFAKVILSRLLYPKTNVLTGRINGLRSLPVD